MIILREGFSEQNTLFSVVLFDKKYTKTTAFGSDICVRMTYEWSDGQKVQ